VRQLKLHERLARRAGEFVIWDVGLGAAANALAVLRVAREIPGAIRLASFDNTLEPLVFALQNAGQLGYFTNYLRYAQHLVAHRRICFDNGSSLAQWRLVLGDFP